MIKKGDQVQFHKVVATGGRVMTVVKDQEANEVYLEGFKYPVPVNSLIMKRGN